MQKLTYFEMILKLYDVTRLLSDFIRFQMDCKLRNADVNL